MTGLYLAYRFNTECTLLWLHYSRYMLPIAERIKYKLCLLVYKMFLGHVPSGAALDWLQSYLTSRCVRRGSARSTHKTVRFGVTQGSVLGPLLFTAGLINLSEGYGVNPHLYADGTQIQGSCRFGSANQLQSTLSPCMDEVSDWMLSNRLQLNTLVFDYSSAEPSAICCCSCRRELDAALDNCSWPWSSHRQQCR